MKRSEVNAALRELEAMCEKYCCYLPPFCHFTPEQWQDIGHEYDEVRDCMLGWDITDYGLGNFDKFGFSLIASALTLSIMVLPVIIRSTEEALFTVPDSYREGSLALGASKLATLFRVVLPSAIPGILSAIILSMGRVMGETAAVYYTAGTLARTPASITSSTRSLAVHLYLLVKEGLNTGEAFATATILIVIIVGLNALADFIAKRLSRKLTGGN